MSVVDDIFKLYYEALEEIEVLGTYFEKDMRRYNEKFCKEFFCWMFESLLQYSLVEVACVDGRMDAREVVMINKVSRYADIVVISNNVLKTSLEWEDFVDADTETIKKWLRDFKAVVLKPLKDSFVPQFATFDAVKYGDSLGKVRDGISALMVLLMHVDDKCGEEEKRAVYDSYVMQTFDEIKQEIDAMQRNRS